MPSLDNFTIGNYGLGGPENVKFSKGIGASASVSLGATGVGGGIISNPWPLTVTGLNFKPNRVILRYNQNLNALFTSVYQEMVNAADGYRYISTAHSDGQTAFLFRIGQTLGDGNYYVYEGGFRLPILNPSTSVVWEAYEA